MTAGLAVLEISGDLDVGSAPLVYQRIQEALGRGDPILILDLAGVDLIDWAGVGVVAAALWRVRSGGGELTIRGANAAVREALDVSRISEIVKVS